MAGEYFWVARYKDGGHLSQYNEDGSENKYADIQRDLLRAFEIYVKHEKLPEPKRILSYHFETPEKDLIWRKRNYMDQATGQSYYVVLVGWQMNVEGKNIQSISVIFPDGSIEVIGKWNEEDRYFDAPVRHEWEGEKIVGVTQAEKDEINKKLKEKAKSSQK